jgi:hypothetical protein
MGPKISKNKKMKMNAFKYLFFLKMTGLKNLQNKIENEWRKDENSFCDEEIHGIILHPRKHITKLEIMERGLCRSLPFACGMDLGFWVFR